MKNSIKKFAYTTLACSLFIMPNAQALTKDETVYVKLKSNGSVKKTIVNEHLRDLDGKNSDISNLKDILNVNGDEKINHVDGKLTWETTKNELYYQGTTDKELPVKTHVTYKLDGKQKKLSKIIGKKGKIEISVDYKNDSCQVIDNNKVCTPFVLTLGTIISNKYNHNIEVTNGKVVSNGASSTVVAIAAPGLDDSLNMDSLSNLNNITISFDTDKFELNPIYTVMTSKLIDNDDLKVFDKLDSIYGSVDQLSSSSKKIVAGSRQLLDGSTNLKDGASKLNDGVSSLSNGSNKIVSKVNDAINTLKNDNSEAIDSATLNAIKTQAETTATLTEIQKQQIAAQTEQTIKASEQYKNFELKVSGYSNKLATVNSSIAQLETAMSMISDHESEQYKGLENQLTTLKTTKVQLETGIETYSGMMKLMVETAKNTAITVASNTSKTVAGKTATTVATKVANNAKATATTKTINQLQQLVSGLNQLNNGITSLKNGTSSLYDGTKKIESGASTLNDGIVKFDKEGISKVSSLVNNRIKPLHNRVKSVIELGNKYDSFANKDGNDEGNTKFIMVIDAKKK